MFGARSITDFYDRPNLGEIFFCFVQYHFRSKQPTYIATKFLQVQLIRYKEYMYSHYNGKLVYIINSFAELKFMSYNLVGALNVFAMYNL